MQQARVRYTPGWRHVDVVLGRVQHVRHAKLVKVLEVLHGLSGSDDDSRIDLVAVHSHPHPLGIVLVDWHPEKRFKKLLLEHIFVCKHLSNLPRHHPFLRRVNVERPCQEVSCGDVGHPGLGDRQSHDLLFCNRTMKWGKGGMSWLVRWG